MTYPNELQIIIISILAMAVSILSIVLNIVTMMRSRRRAEYLREERKRRTNAH